MCLRGLEVYWLSFFYCGAI